MNHISKTPPPLDRFWTITFPLAVVIVISAGLLVLAVVAGGQGDPKLGQWSAISIILFILPSSVIGIVLFLVMIGCIYGISRLNGHISGWLSSFQAFVAVWSLKIQKISDKLVKPIIDIASDGEGDKKAIRYVISKARDRIYPLD